MIGISSILGGMDERLRPIERLQRSYEFRKVFDRGTCFRTPCLRVHFQRSDRELSRLGLVVSRRVGKATRRVRVKRMLRDIFRRHKDRLPQVMDVVLIPRGPPRPHHEYLVAYLRFLEKIGSNGVP